MPTTAVKNHSFRRYLFLLIASFIVVLVTFQLWFFSYIQAQIKTEIQQRSVALSNVAVKVASERLFVSQQLPATGVVVTPHEKTLQQPPPEEVTKEESATEERTIRITVIDTPKKEVDLGDGYIFITGEQTKTLHIDYGEQADPLPLKRIVKSPQQLHQPVTGGLEFSTIGDAFQLALAEPESNVISRHIVQFDEASVIDQYFGWLIFITVLLMLAGIVYALWLAGTVSRPLENLAEGFKALEQGEYGTQVKVQGIDDMRRTMAQFNDMSSNLQALKQMEQQLSQQQQLLELNEVTRGLAHTLRNPLNTIGLAIEEMTDADMSDEQKQLLAQQVREKITRLDNTIKTMLSMNVQDVDRSQDTDLVAVIQDIILEFGFSFAAKIHFEPVLYIALRGAQTEIRAIVHTLIANAVEASTASSGKATDIHVFAQRDEQRVTVRIIDQGKGLAEHIKPDLFKPHVSDKPEGAGMGLFIANRICQSYYHGNIHLDDNQPNGCIATVVFGTPAVNTRN